VGYLAARGIVSGYADGTFRPSNPATRGQIAKIIVLGEGWPLDTSGGPHFTDVPPGYVFYPCAGYIPRPPECRQHGSSQAPTLLADSHDVARPRLGKQ
jgi:hypothetical protein